jgi:metal-dependent amidase/aminoacylase/carboxypeptidase family protein
MLHAHRGELAGKLKFCFQPCEEDLDEEGFGGNELMIRDGVLESPHVDRTLALHL